MSKTRTLLELRRAPSSTSSMLASPTVSAHARANAIALLAGGVVGVTLGILGVVAGYLLWKRKRDRRKRMPPNYNAKPLWSTAANELDESNLQEVAELPATPPEPAELDGLSLKKHIIASPKRCRTVANAHQGGQLI